MKLSEARTTANGMPCCFDIPEAQRTWWRDGPCNICPERRHDDLCPVCKGTGRAALADREDG